MALAYIGLGSNLDGPVEHVRQALGELQAIDGVIAVRYSRLYRSAPLGPADQPDYVNAVAELETTLGPVDLLHAMQAIEQTHGRVRGAERWGPRTLDLDLLVYDGLVLETPELTLPHPQMVFRGFVLIPLAEIAPDLEVPRHGIVSVLAARVAREGLQPLGADHD